MARINSLIVCENEVFVRKLTNFIASNDSSCESSLSGIQALDLIVEKGHQIVFVSSDMSDLSAQDFIIKASQKKVFSTTTFILVNQNKLSEDEKIRYMTLGFSDFIDYTFDQNNQNNLIKIYEIEKKLIAA